MKQYINILFGLCLSLTLCTSCDLDVTAEEVVLSDDYLGDDNLDARSALFGVLAQMQEAAGQYVVLGEMRADLVDVTDSSGDDLRKVSRHNFSEDNGFIDPTTLFAIINNCNFALAGIDTVANEEELLEDYASILRVRTWAQLQILINYGKLPYITKPIKSDDDLDETYPLLSFEDGINALIQNLEPITGIENVSKFENSLSFSIYNMIPDQDVLLGDLNLWNGNYELAARHYKNFLDEAIAFSGWYNLDSSNGVDVSPSGAEYTYDSDWYRIHATLPPRSNEVINYVGFSEEFRQTNEFAIVLQNQMKASLASIQNFADQSLAYEKEPVQLGDSRAQDSYYDFGNPDYAPIRKYIADDYYLILYRAAKVYLRYAEAINYLGYPNHALTIVNGIFNDINTAPKDALVFGNEEDFLNFDNEDYYTYNSSDEPTGGNLGVRGRVSMAAVSVAEDITDPEAIITAAGVYILNEAALELAFEGNRWEDLVRFAKRAEDPSILADAVAQKFEAAGEGGTAALVRAKLMNPENWFLPLTMPENFIENY